MQTNSIQPYPAKPSRLFPYAQLLLRLCLAFGIVVSAFNLLSSDKGLIQNHLLLKQIASAHNQIEASKEQNAQLARMLVSLRTDLDMVEYIARHELLMVGPNEILFDLSAQP